MDIDTLKIKLNDIKKKIVRIKEALRLNEKEKRVDELEKETIKEGFFEDSKRSAAILSEMKTLKDIIEKMLKIDKDLSDAVGYLELAEEMNDLESYKESKKILDNLDEKLEVLEIDTLLCDEYDSNNAIVTIHPGARWN